MDATAALPKTIDLAIVEDKSPGVNANNIFAAKEAAYAQSLYGSGSIRALTLELRRLASPATPLMRVGFTELAYR